MAKPDFSKQWASSRATIPAIDAGDYAQGWNFRQGLPPLVDNFDYVMQLQDLRSVWLQEQFPVNGTTAVIRNFMAQGTQSEARDALGIGTGAIYDVQSSVTDSTKNKVLIMGDSGPFGLGKAIPISDANNAVKPGFYGLPTSLGAVNSPVVGVDGVIIASAVGDSIMQQWFAAGDYNSDAGYIRHYRPTSDQWTGWTAATGGGAGAVALVGPDTVTTGSTNTYTITNYSSFSVYSVSSSAGSASISDETVTLTIAPGETADALTLTVNKDSVPTSFNIAIGTQVVGTPSILSPTNGETDVGPTVTLYSSAFQTFPSNADTHASSDWQLATDAGFTNVVWSSMADAVNKTSIQVPEGVMQPNTDYYCRVRHNATSIGSSAYSAGSTFKTRLAFFPTNEIVKLVSSGAVVSGGFGYSMSMSSDGLTAVIGARTEQVGGVVSGAAYVFEFSGGSWVEVARLAPSDPQAGDFFGNSVDISGDGLTVIIGAVGKDTFGVDAGAAYIFKKSGGTWSQIVRINHTFYDAGDQFGRSVAINGNGTIAVVGANLENQGGTDAGAAFVFSNSGGSWTQIKELIPADLSAEDQFGVSCSINSAGDIVAIGSLNTNSPRGGVYIFESVGGVWGEVAKLTPTGNNSNMQFGTSVSLNQAGDVIAVGAIGEDLSGASSGAVYIFSESGGVWSIDQRLQSDDLQAGDSLGSDVSITNDGLTVIAGARLEDTAASNAGAAYLFNKSGGVWSQVGKLIASDAESSDTFGSSVAIAGNGSRIGVGSPQEDAGGFNAGASYMFG